jgi:hypothetical protein
MQNKYITEDDVKQVFFQCKMDNEEGYDFDELLDFADKIVQFSALRIARNERAHCIDFVNSLNVEVGKALSEKRGPL